MVTDVTLLLSIPLSRHNFVQSRNPEGYVWYQGSIQDLPFGGEVPSGRRPKLPRGGRWHGPMEIF